MRNLCNVNAFPYFVFNYSFLQIFPVNTPSGNALPIQLNERQPQADFGRDTRVKRQISNQGQQPDGVEEETLSPLMVRNFPPLAEEKQNCM